LKKLFKVKVEHNQYNVLQHAFKVGYKWHNDSNSYKSTAFEYIIFNPNNQTLKGETYHHKKTINGEKISLFPYRKITLDHLQKLNPKKRNYKQRKARPIILIKGGMANTYASIKQACEKLNIKYHFRDGEIKRIYSVINGREPKFKGYKWSYFDVI